MDLTSCHFPLLLALLWALWLWLILTTWCVPPQILCTCCFCWTCLSPLLSAQCHLIRGSYPSPPSKPFISLFILFFCRAEHSIWRVLPHDLVSMYYGVTTLKCQFHETQCGHFAVSVWCVQCVNECPAHGRASGRICVVNAMCQQCLSLSRTLYLLSIYFACVYFTYF